MDVVHVITREEMCTQSNIELVSLDALNYDKLPKLCSTSFSCKDYDIAEENINLCTFINYSLSYWF